MSRGIPSQEAENGETLAFISLFVPFIQIRMQYRERMVWGSFHFIEANEHSVPQVCQGPVSQGILAPSMLTVEIIILKNLSISHLFCTIRYLT